MTHVFRPTFRDKRTAATRQTKFWYARIGGRRVPLKVTDRRVAERKAAELERQAELGHDPAQLEKARRRSVEHLLEFEDSVRARGCGHGHLKNLLPRLQKVTRGAGFRTLADVDSARAEAWLACRQRDGGMSAQTRKHYAAHLRQFGEWLVSAGRAVRNPFVGLRKDLNVQADRRRVRRALTHQECRRLLATVRTSNARRGRMRGRDRYFVYALALATGLRRNELGSLTPEAFDLDGATPTVTVNGAWTKNRKQARLPLRRDLAEELRPWLAGKPTGQALFPIKDKQINLTIRADLGEAGIPFEVAGRVVDFHALRVTFVSHLALAGVPLATAQKLARHSDPRLTANVYTHLGLADLSRAVEDLPALGGAAPPAERERPDYETGPETTIAGG